MKPKYVLTALAVIACLTLMLSPVTYGQEEKTHAVKKGDTLWDISQHYYGNPELWPALWALNQHRVSNPHRISVGDVLVIYEKAKLEKKIEEIAKAEIPAPPPKPESLYEPSQPIETLFPKHFTYAANPEGLEKTGINRLQVKKAVYDTRWVVGDNGDVQRVREKKIIDTIFEAYKVGDIIASEERGSKKTTGELIHGQVLLSYFDNVIVSFTSDVAGILDSAAHGEPDPYFREYPIYSMGGKVEDPVDDTGQTKLGQLFHFKGMLKVVARVETSQVEQKKGWRLFKSKEKDKTPAREPIYYVARITNSREPIQIGDMIFLFKRIQ